MRHLCDRGCDKDRGLMHAIRKASSAVLLLLAHLVEMVCKSCKTCIKSSNGTLKIPFQVSFK